MNIRHVVRELAFWSLISTIPGKKRYVPPDLITLAFRKKTFFNKISKNILYRFSILMMINIFVLLAYINSGGVEILLFGVLYPAVFSLAYLLFHICSRWLRDEKLVKGLLLGIVLLPVLWFFSLICYSVLFFSVQLPAWFMLDRLIISHEFDMILSIALANSCVALLQEWSRRPSK